MGYVSREENRAKIYHKYTSQIILLSVTLFFFQLSFFVIHFIRKNTTNSLLFLYFPRRDKEDEHVHICHRE